MLISSMVLSFLIYSIFCQVGLPIVEREVLKSPNVIVDLCSSLVSPFLFCIVSRFVVFLVHILLGLLWLFCMLIVIIRSLSVQFSSVAQSCLTLRDPWTLFHQASVYMGFSRQEYWNGLPFTSPVDVPNPGINLCLFHLLHWQVFSLPLVQLGNLYIS